MADRKSRFRPTCTFNLLLTKLPRYLNGNKYFQQMVLGQFDNYIQNKPKQASVFTSYNTQRSIQNDS